MLFKKFMLRSWWTFYSLVKANFDAASLDVSSPDENWLCVLWFYCTPDLSLATRSIHQAKDCPYATMLLFFYFFFRLCCIGCYLLISRYSRFHHKLYFPTASVYQKESVPSAHAINDRGVEQWCSKWGQGCPRGYWGVSRDLAKHNKLFPL